MTELLWIGKKKERILRCSSMEMKREMPRYLRRVPSVDNLIPILYLKGISTGDMSEAMESILGPGAAG